jgi:hypothetical protein
MKIRISVRNAALALLLALAPAGAAYSQDTGRSSQPGTSSLTQPPPKTPTPSVENSGPAQGNTVPGVNANETRPQPDLVDTGRPTKKSSWTWLILGFFIGLLVGALAWRQPVTVGRDETGRRAA